VIYHGLDKGLVDFVYNPIKYKDYLKRRVGPSREGLGGLIDRITEKKTDLQIFEECLFNLLLQAEKQIESLLSFSCEVVEIERESALEQIKEYLRIIVKADPTQLDSQSYRAEMYEYIDNQIATTFGYHADRISELYQLETGRLLSSAGSVIIPPMLLSEIYAFIRLNYIDLERQKGGFILKMNDRFLPEFHAHTLTELLESNSTLSLQYYLSGVATKINRRFITIELAQEAITYVLDKVLSLQERYLSDAVREGEHFELIKGCIAIMLVSEVFSMHKCNVPASFLINNGICSASVINFVVSNLSALNPKQVRLFSVLSFVKGEFSRGNLEFNLATRHLVYAASNLYSDRNKRDNNLLVFGDAFERDYIYRYASTLDRNRYKIYPSISPGNKADVKGYDIDLVIEDVLFGQFYFIQVKYKKTRLPKFFSERCYELKTGFIRDYERQLRVFRDNLLHPSIQRKLRQDKYKGLERATTDNSHFVFVHNVPFLNLYGCNGIYFYEWNFFRNLMRGGMMLWEGRGGFGHEKQKPFPLHDTKTIVELYTDKMKAHEKSSIPSVFYAHTNALVQLKVKSKRKDVHFDVPLV